ncbi:HNH endonuclease [Mycobacterium sp.]|uniref:HNH endonuclease n=2 Tax=Mycobacterium sp. TaxID=1785 RepID=UPI003F9A0AB4
MSVVSADGMKTCTRCEKEPPLDRFYRDPTGHGGYRSICKTCMSARMKTWYADNQVRQRDRQRVRFAANNATIRERDMERYRRNRDARLQLAIEATHRRRARLKGADRADRGISYKALRERDGSKCYHCGAEMSFDTKKYGEYEPRRATIEHIVPISRGGLHIWDNVALACWECNIRRGAPGSRTAGSDGGDVWPDDEVEPA